MQEDIIKSQKSCRRRALYKGGMMQEDIYKSLREGWCMRTLQKGMYGEEGGHHKREA